MIDKLLEYQEKDKAAIALRMTVECGRVKREINASNRILNDARAQLLTLEDDAKNLTTAYENVEKAIADLIDKTKHLTAQKDPKNEDEIQSAAALVSALIQKISTHETQLESIAKTINLKAKQFDDAKNAVVKAQASIKNLTPQYESQLKDIKPKLDEFAKAMDAIAQGIDKPLIEKYRSRRARESTTAGKIPDVVVNLSTNRCGGCYVELPLSLVHKISTDGYVICEGCGKIIHKG